MRGIGYYVHHQGAGHRERALRIAGALERSCALIGTFGGSLGQVPSLDLPDDRLTEGFDGRDGALTRPLGLHYAPLGHPGVQARMAAIAAWVARTDPVLMIVDVSVEVALLARLLCVPTLYVRLAGTRTDLPHLEAFRAAERLIAPFPEAIDSPGLPDWVRAKTIYAGFLGPTVPTVPTEAAAKEDGSIAVVFGRGGGGGDLADLIAAARAVPDRAWHVYGAVVGPDGLTGAALGAVDPHAGGPPNLNLHGWVDDPRPHLARASLIVGGAGDGLLATVASGGKRFLCLPEPRAFDEQTQKAEALGRLGAALVHPGWPVAEDWPGLVACALSLDPTVLAHLYDPAGVRRLAWVIDGTAREIEVRSGMQSR